MITLRPRPCPVCGRPESAVRHPASVDPAALGEFAFASRKLPEYMHWQLKRCRTCDVLFADPAPSVSDLARLYRDAAFDSGPEAGRAARTYGRYLPEALRGSPGRSGALDIGTGDGAFLRELLAAGFSGVRGVEPSTAPIEAAGPDVRPLITQGLFEPGAFPADSFDLVTCFQTIEHLDDPIGVCREALRVLRPGGVLFLVGHDRLALSARLLGRRSPIFDVEHLQLFSQRAARALLREAGFANVRAWPIWNRYPVSYWARLFPLPGGLKAAAQGILARTGLGRVPVPLPAGNLAAAGRKPF